MATVTNLVQYFVKGAVEGFSAKVLPLTAFAYAVEENGAGNGDIVKVPLVSNISASSDFTYAGGYSGNGNSVAGKDVTLNIHKYQAIELTDNEILRLSPEVVQKLGAVAGARLGSDFMSASLASVVTAGNFSNASTYPAAGFTSSVAPLTLMKQCDDLNWPDDGRALVIPTTVYFNMLSNTAISAAEQYGNAAAIQRGEIPQVFGMTPYKVTFGVGNGFVANTSALAFALAPHKPQAEGNGVVETMIGKDEKTGIVITMRSWYDPQYAKTIRVIEALGGVAAVNGSALIRIS